MSNYTKKYSIVLLLAIPTSVFLFYFTGGPQYSRRVTQKIFHSMKNLSEPIATQSIHDFRQSTMDGNDTSSSASHWALTKLWLLQYIQKCKKTRKKAVIIYAPSRSGSTFLGEFFNRHSEVYYLFEPLHNIGFNKTNGSAIRQIILEDLFLCNYSRIPRLYENVPNDKWSKCRSNICFSSRSEFLWRNTNLCAHEPPFCGIEKFDPRQLEKICQQSLFTAMKVISLTSLSSLVPLLTDPRLDLKVIQLVRDPRAVVPSEMKMLNKSGNTTLEKVTKQLCSRYHSDWLYHKQCILGFNVTESKSIDSSHCNNSIKTLWKDKFIRLSHEFVSEDPMRAMRIIYGFVGLNFDRNVRNWIRLSTNTTANRAVWNDKSDIKNGFYGTIRNSKILLNKWRLSQPFSTVRYIEMQCNKAMKELGYTPARTPEMLTSISKNLYTNAKSVYTPGIAW